MSGDAGWISVEWKSGRKGIGLIPSANFSLGTLAVTEGGGANVGYLTDVSLRQLDMSIGEALVKSEPGVSNRSHLAANDSLSLAPESPAMSRATSLALLTSFMPPRQAKSVFHSNNRIFFTGKPLGNRSFRLASIENSTKGRGGDMATVSTSV